MRYIKATDKERASCALASAGLLDLDQVANIHRTGSVRGMQSIYGWPQGGHVRCGGYIYNVGLTGVERLRSLGLLRGES